MNTADFVSEREAFLARQMKDQKLNYRRIEPITSARAASDETSEDNIVEPEVEADDDVEEDETSTSNPHEMTPLGLSMITIVIGLVAIVVAAIVVMFLKRKSSSVSSFDDGSQYSVGRSEYIADETLKFA